MAPRDRPDLFTRLCPIEKINQRLGRWQRCLNLSELCIAETGNVTNEVNEPVLQHASTLWVATNSRRLTRPGERQRRRLHAGIVAGEGSRWPLPLTTPMRENTINRRCIAWGSRLPAASHSLLKPKTLSPDRPRVGHDRALLSAPVRSRQQTADGPWRGRRRSEVSWFPRLRHSSVPAQYRSG